MPEIRRPRRGRKCEVDCESADNVFLLVQPLAEDYRELPLRTRKKPITSRRPELLAGVQLIGPSRSGASVRSGIRGGVCEREDRRESGESLQPLEGRGADDAREEQVRFTRSHSAIPQHA